MDTTTSPLITEWHTSDLNSRCSKRVQLKHLGKAIPEVGSAMFRGVVFHSLAEAWHMGEQFDVKDAYGAIAREGRRLTLAAARDADAIVEEMRGLLSHYIARYAGYFGASKLLGCEVPVRWTVDVDGIPVDFASHMDLLFRDPHGALCLWDWKTGDTDWDSDHAGRSKQVGMYFMAVQYGQVMLGDEWVELQEAPSVSVVNVENCKPYSRKTTAKDESGQEKEFVKGDVRPENSVRYEVLCNNEGAIVDAFATHVRMDRAGLWPTNPTDTGCRVCDCRMACPTWSMTNNEEQPNENF